MTVCFFIFGIVLNPIHGQHLRFEKYDLSGNLVFGKDYLDFDTDAESILLDGNKILLTGGQKYDDTIDILTLKVLDGSILSRNKYFDPRNILLSPNSNDLMEYNGQYVLVSTSEIFEEILQDRIIGHYILSTKI